MKNKRIYLAAIACLTSLVIAAGISAQADPLNKELDVIFLHDTHSHLESFSTIMDGEVRTVGGFAKIRTLIEEHKAENPDTLVVDGGDFSMGTLVQTVYDSEAAELRMLGTLGVEASTLGNHEYDYRSRGLADMLVTAAESGDQVPELLISNLDWEAMEEAGLTEDQQMLKDAFERYGVKEYSIIQKGDVKIALIGIFGKDALDCAPTCALLFKDASKAAAEAVKQIETEEPDTDMIVCLSHGGTWEDEEKSEDEILAKNVPEIDLIISGHTHSTLEEPIRQGSITIVSCGEYGKNMGSLSMEQQSDGTWDITEYELIPVSDEIPEDPEAAEKIEAFLASVDTNYLAEFGYTRDQVLAENRVQFCTVKDLSEIHEEQNLGSLIADAYAYAVEHTADWNGERVDVAVAPSGTIRDTYPIGDVTVEQVFNSFSLGIGRDGIPGYPLVKTWLTGKELKIVAEIDASISDLMTSARLYMNGLQFSFHPKRMILNKVTDCYLMQDGNRVELEDDKLYCVVADLYSAQMLGAVTDMSYGLLSIVPKFEDGTPAENYEDLIITTEGRELKAWAAIAQYMESFEDADGDGISDIPEEYTHSQGRKVVEDSKNIIDLVKNPNRFTCLIVGMIAAVIALFAGIIVALKKVFRKKKKCKCRKNKMG
ncbi:MAG: bifunctional metallophosphatase/5'-nucleotidase [Lachnospiraceae bacterium]